MDRRTPRENHRHHRQNRTSPREAGDQSHVHRSDQAHAVIRPKLSVVANEVTSPDELIKVLKRYLRESNQSERAVASRIGVKHHTLNRWLTTAESPTKGRLALAACFLRRVGYQ